MKGNCYLTSSETVSFSHCFYPYDVSDPSVSAFAAVVYFKMWKFY